MAVSLEAIAQRVAAMAANGDTPHEQYREVAKGGLTLDGIGANWGNRQSDPSQQEPYIPIIEDETTLK
jgi:hypothetical protein